MDLVAPISAAVVLILILSLVYGDKARQARRSRLASWASTKGFQVNQSGLSQQKAGWLSSPLTSANGQFIDDYRIFQPIRSNPRGRVNMVATRAKGDLTWTIFEYEYSDGEYTSVSTICSVQQPRIFPTIDIRPQDLGNKIGNALGANRVKVGSAEFDRRMQVRSENESATQALVTPRLISFVLRTSGVHWQLSGNRLVVVVSGRLENDRVDSTCGLMKGFLDQLRP